MVYPTKEFNDNADQLILWPLTQDIFYVHYEILSS